MIYFFVFRRKLLVLFPLILVTQIPEKCSGQQIVHGIVVDAATRQSIPYASISIPFLNQGINADSAGIFDYYIPNNITDSIQISSVGYSTKTFATANLPKNKLFELERFSLKLNDVIITSYFDKKEILGNFKNCNNNFFTTHQGNIKQYAQRFNAPTINCRLSSIEICKQASFAKFKIRVYDYDSVTGGPGKDLVDTLIEIATKRKNISIALSRYQIFIPSKIFYVGIEWIYNAENAIINRYKIEGRKIEQTTYGPLLSFISEKKGYSNGQVWEIDFRDKWRPVLLAERLLISSTVEIPIKN